jgi:hypothetical protein
MPNSQNYQLSEEGARKVTQNLPEEAKFKPLHGLYTYMATNVYPTQHCPIHSRGLCPRCQPEDKFCRAVDELKGDVIDELSQIEYLQGIHNRILVHEFAQDVCYLFIIDRWVSYVSTLHSYGDGEIDLQPVLKRRWTIAESMRRMAESLSITPKQMIDLGLSARQFKDYAVRAQELKQRGGRNAD